MVVTPERGVRAVDGLLTGWHEPEASHLLMLEAVAGRRPLELAYRAAYDAGYLWHEFGDSHLLLRSVAVTPRAVVPDRVAPPLPEGRRNVLYAVRRRGEATAEQVAEQLGMTVSGARQHLSALVDEGLAEAAESAEPTGKRGRRSARLRRHPRPATPSSPRPTAS